MSSCTGRRRADRSRCRTESLSCEKNVGRVEEGPKSVVIVFATLLFELEFASTGGWCSVGNAAEVVQERSV